MKIFYLYIQTLCIITATLKHVAKTVAHVDLSDHIIQVVYTIFDENSEFLSVGKPLFVINRLCCCILYKL